MSQQQEMSKNLKKCFILTYDLNFCRAGQKTRSLKLKLNLQQLKLFRAEFRGKSFRRFREKLNPEHLFIIRDFGSKYC